jgi:hypothetical protein
MTDHEAHKSVSAWSTRALTEVGKPGSTVHHATTTPDWAERWVPVYNRFEIFRPGTPPVTPRDDLSIEFPLPPDLLEVKLAAIQVHVSQVGAMVDAFGEDIFRQAMAEETFRLGAAKA